MNCAYAMLRRIEIGVCPGDSTNQSSSPFVLFGTDTNLRKTDVADTLGDIENSFSIIVGASWHTTVIPSWLSHYNTVESIVIVLYQPPFMPLLAVNKYLSRPLRALRKTKTSSGPSDQLRELAFPLYIVLWYTGLS